MSLENKVPEIRFEGFSREWTLQKLKKVVSLENGFAFKSRYFQDEVSDLIVLTPGSVNIGGGFQEGKGHFYNEMGNFPTKYILKAGDIFVTMTDLTPTAQALGFPAIVPEDGRTYLHNQRLGKLTNFEGNKEFLFYLLSTSKNQKRIVLTSSGTTVKHSSPDKILNGERGYPEKSEQTKIGKYFQQLDTLITQHQQKHDKLLNIKKALLEKMFPKQGEDVPEIRFKGFSGEWEEKELNNIGEATSGTSIESEFSEDGKYKVVSIGSYSEKSIYTDQGIRAHLSKKTKVRILNSGDLTMILNDKTSTGNIIGRALLILEDDVFIYNQRTQRIEPYRDKYDSQFLYQLFNAPFVREKIIKQSQGNTQIYVNWSAIKRLLYLIPKKKEQIKIGKLFQQMDALLTQHNTQLKKLKNIKQACLEKMFV